MARLVDEELKKVQSETARMFPPRRTAELAKTSWAMQLAGAYKKIFVVRKGSTLKRIEECARWDQKQAEKKHVIWNVCSWLAYIGVFLLAITVFVPPFVAFYVQSEIRAGNWVNVEQAANIT